MKIIKFQKCLKNSFYLIYFKKSYPEITFIKILVFIKISLFSMNHSNNQ